MQYKILLAGTFLLPTLITNNSFISFKEPGANISLHFKKSTNHLFWEMGKTKDPATDTTSLKQSEWYQEAMKNIAAREYHFEWEEKIHAYCTPNRKNNLRFFYDENGFSVEPRTTQIPIGVYDPMKRPGEIKYKQLPDWKVQFNLDKKQIGKGVWKVADSKAEYVTNNITVQYINNEEGMRQNFIVQKPLSNKDELKINFSIKTKLKIALTNSQLQFSHKKAGNVLNYTDLKVWDANNKPLEAGFTKNRAGEYSIRVNDDDAVYPITIDPISTTPNATVEGNQADAWFGRYVASAGDVNRDGYSDIIVTAFQYDNGQVDEGAAFIFHGSATGIATLPAAMVESNYAGAYMGRYGSTAGDVNGDGYSDVIVGAENYSNGQSSEGAAFVYLGSATGINTTAANILECNQVGARFGYSVACAGDVNGDGYSDVAVGVYFYTNGQSSEGAAFIYHGSASGLNNTAAAIVESNQFNARMGNSVGSAGDVNGDGYSDVIVGAFAYSNGQTDEGAAFIYHGSATGINTSPAAILEQNQASAAFGEAVAAAGDVNGDGYCDVIVGAYQYNNGQSLEGVAFVYHGSATGINTVAAVLLERNQAGASFGFSVGSAGDINGDGFSDVCVGAPSYTNTVTNEGAAFVYPGTAGGIVASSFTILPTGQTGSLLWSVNSAGDVNGDGYSDLVTGAFLYDNGQTDEGAAFVYHGSAGGINNTAAKIWDSNQANAQLGYSVASAGDVNGDGYSDVIIGAPYADIGSPDDGCFVIFLGSANGVLPGATQINLYQTGANFGWSVSSAGDVNGDGYGDVIVGAPLFDNGQTDEGAAFVFYGSAGGINNAIQAQLESNQANADMGHSVASAGDVNGDGYSDVIVGARLYDNGQTDEGSAFVYHGSATGINTSATAMIESNQASARMGISVNSAGDVNGDGYSDVIVGANYYDNGQTDEGAAFVYQGSAAGINTTVAAMVESNQVDARMGFSVASAGDVNADGYSDVIVGDILYDSGQIDEGAAFIYNGSATGINTVATVILECNQADANMGSSVSTAGDVNGDGYSDVIVGVFAYDNGQANEGRAFVYLGSVIGVNTTATTIVESNQANAWMGWCVATAGDVNGDGYSDVIVGVPNYDNGQTDEGAYFVYHGNSPGTNLRNNLRLYNTNLTIPINNSNFLLSNFGAGLFAKSFLGRVKGKLVWETRLNFNAYSGTPITNSTFFTAQQSSNTDLGLAGVELKNLIDKISAGGRYTKLRARVKYDPVTAITGQVYGPWRNVSAIIDGNSLGALPIELISFNAAWLQKGRSAKINFTTDKESGICCFDIEKSGDGFHFYKIGTLPAKNISGVQTYSFIDGNATAKKQIYRLKIKGIAGQIDYSNIQQLQNNEVTEILVFPNPTTDVLQLQLNKVYDKMNVEIVNSAGQMVKQLQLLTTDQTITIPVQNLASGQYWLRLQGGGEKQVLQFVKE